jgi:hypothetical protein
MVINNDYIRVAILIVIYIINQYHQTFYELFSNKHLDYTNLNLNNNNIRISYRLSNLVYSC